jgi:hypothetical protein
MWSQAVERARQSRGWNEDEFRQRVMDRDVSSAVVTNWKGGRPIPPARYPLLAEVVGISVDELIGRPPRVRESTVFYGERDEQAAMLAAEITKLDPVMREFITTMIEVLVAKQKRAERKKPALRGKSLTT